MFIFTIETIIVAALLVLFILMTLYFGIKKYFKQRNCNHKTYYETMSCDAVCSSCGKNLGFIGPISDDK